MSTQPVSVDPANVQGIIAGGYTHPVSRYLLFRFGSADGARAFVRRLPSITSAADWAGHHPAQVINVGLSFTGLEASGALSREALGESVFPFDFRNGPTPARLHDDGPGSLWRNGVSVAELHCLVSLHALDGDALNRITADVLDTATATGTPHQIVRRDGRTIDGALLTPPRRLHFGYLDGFSGPAFAWDDPARPPALDFRHFVLGYATEEIDSRPRDLGRPGDAEAVAFARDGCYAAFRLMYQDVAAFNRFLGDNASRLAATLGLSEAAAAEWLAAKMLGRWRDGRPLVRDPDGTNPGGVGPEDEFIYADDRQGERCPFSAHIRVTNPRDQRIDASHVPVPRVLRRGMPYGTPLSGNQDDGVDRGLIGLFLCSSLSEQFEKIMDWINRNDFSSVFTDLRAQDPLLGNRDQPLASTTFLIPTPTGPLEARGLVTFVRTRGTAYFLFPSLSALHEFGLRS